MIYGGIPMYNNGQKCVIKAEEKDYTDGDTDGQPKLEVRGSPKLKRKMGRDPFFHRKVLGSFFPIENH